MVSSPHIDTAAIPSGPEEACLSSIASDDFYASAAQIHTMQGADSSSKRRAVYIPAALGLFGVGSLVPEEQDGQDCVVDVAPLPRPVSLGLSESCAEDVIQRLKYQESLVHQAFRTTMLLDGPVAIPIAVNASHDAPADHSSLGEDVCPHRPRSQTPDSDASSWVSVINVDEDSERSSQVSSDLEPQVRFSSLLAGEKERAVRILSYIPTCLSLILTWLFLREPKPSVLVSEQA